MDIQSINRKIYEEVARQKWMDLALLEREIERCNSSRANLAQELVRNRHIKTSDFALLMQKINSDGLDQTLSPESGDLGTRGSPTSVPQENEGGKAVEIFGDYEILGEIARGGMGIVYKARQKKIGRLVALKVLLGGTMAADAQVHRFFREAKAVAALDHPNIVPVYGMGEEKGRHYFSMKYLNGGTFEEVLRKADEPLDRKLGIFLKVCRALGYAHRKKIVHRDIKPSNILMSREGEPYLADFGLVKFIDSDSALTQTGACIGTWFYMSPEQAKGAKGKTDARSDVYSLGVILYQILTGQLPFVADHAIALQRKICEGYPVSPRDLVPEVPVALEDICLKAMEKSSRFRYANGEEMGHDLERFLKGEKVYASRGRVRAKIRKYVRTHRTALAMAFFLLVLGTSIFWGYERSKSEKFLRIQMECSRALGLFTDGREEEAFEIMRANRQKYPTSLEVHLTMASLCQRAGRMTEAKNAMDRAEAIAPRSPNVLFQKSLLCVAQNDFPQALALIDRYIASRPGFCDGYLSRAKILRKMGEEKRASQDIRKANEIVEHAAREEMDKIPSGKEGIAVLNGILARYPEYERGHARRAQLYYEAGEKYEALKDISRAIELDPSPFHFYKKGKWLYESGYFERSLEALSFAWEHLPNGPQRNEIAHLLARVYLALKEYENAHSFYEKALAVQDMPGIRMEMAQVCHLLKKYDLLEKQLRSLEAVSLPVAMKSEVEYYRGFLAFEKKDFVSAEISWENALKGLPKWAGELHYRLALACRELGKREKERAHLEKSAPFYPYNAEIPWMLAQHYEVSDPKKAVALISQSIRLEPWRSDYYFKRGLLYRKIGQSEAGENDFLFCMELDPQDIRPFAELFNDYNILMNPSKTEILFNHFRSLTFTDISPDLWEEEIDALKNSLRFSWQEGEGSDERFEEQERKKAQSLVNALITSDSPSVHEMSSTALLAMSPHVVSIVDDSLQNEKNPAALKRLGLLRSLVYGKFLQSEKERFGKLLIRYCCVRDRKALLEIHQSGQKGWDCLDFILKEEKGDPIVRSWAARALREMREPYCERLLQKNARSGKTTEKVFSAHVLGQGSEQVLKEGLSSPVPFVRTYTISALPSTFPIPLVDGLLEDPDIKVRLAAAAFLRKYDHEKAENVLAGFFSSPSRTLSQYALSEYWDFSEIRQRFGEAMPVLAWGSAQKFLHKGSFTMEEIGISKASQEKAFARVTRPNEEWIISTSSGKRYFFTKKETGVFVHRSTPRYEAIYRRNRSRMGELISRSDSPIAKVRKIVLCRLAESGDPQYDEKIKSAVQDPDPLNRFFSLLILAGNGELEIVMPVLCDGTTPFYIRAGILQGGMEKLGKSAMKHLFQMIHVKRESDLASRVYILRWMGTIDSPLATNLLHGYLKDSSPETRIGAIFGMEATGKSRKAIYPVLEKMLEDPHPSVRSVAAGSCTYLARYHDLPILPALHDRLKKGHPNMRKGGSIGYMKALREVCSIESHLKKTKSWEWNDLYLIFLKVLEAEMVCMRTVLHEKEHFTPAWNMADFLECCGKAIDLYPENAEAFLERGIFHYVCGSYKESLSDLREGIRLKPDFVGPKIWVARSLVGLHDYEGAGRAAEETLHDLPWDYEFHDLLLNFWKTSGEKGPQHDERLALLEEKLALREGQKLSHVERMRQRVRIHLVAREKDHEKALAGLTGLLQILDEKAYIYTERALVREAKGDIQGAMEDEEKTVQLLPTYAQGYVVKGRMLRIKGELQESLAQLDKAVAMRHSYAWSRLERALTRKRMGNQQGSLDDLRKAIEMNPKYVGAHVEKGLLLREMGEEKEALESFSAALSLDPQCERALSAMRKK